MDGGAGEDELIGGGARSGNWLEVARARTSWRGERPPITTAGRIRSLSPLATTRNDGEAGEGDFVSSEIIAVFGGEGDDDLTILTPGGAGKDAARRRRRRRHPVDPALPVRGHDYGGGGPDAIRNEAKNGLVHGANGDDLIFGGDGPQALWGEGGDDTLRGLDGDDFLLGNRGADIFLPGPGNDSVAGGHGPDTIFARDGQRDSLSGGPGKEDRARVDRELDKVYDMEGLF